MIPTAADTAAAPADTTPIAADAALAAVHSSLPDVTRPPKRDATSEAHEKSKRQRMNADREVMLTANIIEGPRIRRPGHEVLTPPDPDMSPEFITPPTPEMAPLGSLRMTPGMTPKDAAGPSLYRQMSDVSDLTDLGYLSPYSSDFDDPSDGDSSQITVDTSSGTNGPAHYVQEGVVGPEEDGEHWFDQLIDETLEEEDTNEAPKVGDIRNGDIDFAGDLGNAGINSSVGDVGISGFLGDVDISSALGEVEINGTLGNVSISGLLEDIDISGFFKDIDISNFLEDVDIRNFLEDVNINGALGIEIDDVLADVGIINALEAADVNETLEGNGVEKVFGNVGSGNAPGDAGISNALEAGNVNKTRKIDGAEKAPGDANTNNAPGNVDGNALGAVNINNALGNADISKVLGDADESLDDLVNEGDGVKEVLDVDINKATGDADTNKATKEDDVEKALKDIDINRTIECNIINNAHGDTGINEALGINRIKEEDYTDANAPRGEPPAWSEKRQSLCEALPWYKSNQGSIYATEGKMKGILISSETEASDILQSQVIITTIGGGRVKGADGTMHRQKDQDESRHWVKACFRAMEQHHPIGVIVGSSHARLTFKPKHTFSVLDYFHVTDIWREREEVELGPGASKLVNFLKLRLEKVALAAPSWWAPVSDPNRFVPGAATPSEHTCEACAESSIRMFDQCWTCLNHECLRFFNVPEGVDTKALRYSVGFVNKRTQYAGPGPEPLVPALLSTWGDQSLTGTETALRGGGVCPVCKGCFRRQFWDKWVCENVPCGFEQPVPLQPYALDRVLAEWTAFKGKLGETRANPLVGKTAGVLAGYEFEQYYIPGPEDKIIGSITVLRCTEETRKAALGPDYLWAKIQGEDHGLKRNPVRHANLKTEVVTRHFARNFGAPYKFGVPVASLAFADAPETVLRTRVRLSWAGEECIRLSKAHLEGRALSEGLKFDFIPFNELLSLGYRESDAISWHDDGEDTLGPTVGTLSLGSPSVMKFRVKSKSTCLGTAPKKTLEILSFGLAHGDMVIMHGTEIHRHYEHAVHPAGIRRYALTCRYIRPETLSPDVLQDVEEKSRLPPRAADWSYDGY